MRLTGNDTARAARDAAAKILRDDPRLETNPDALAKAVSDVTGVELAAVRDALLNTSIADVEAQRGIATSGLIDNGVRTAGFHMPLGGPMGLMLQERSGVSAVGKKQDNPKSAAERLSALVNANIPDDSTIAWVNRSLPPNAAPDHSQPANEPLDLGDDVAAGDKLQVTAKTDDGNAIGTWVLNAQDLLN